MVHKSAVHNIVLYHWGGAKCSSHKPRWTDKRTLQNVLSPCYAVDKSGHWWTLTQTLWTKWDQGTRPLHPLYMKAKSWDGKSWKKCPLDFASFFLLRRWVISAWSKSERISVPACNNNCLSLHLSVQQQFAYPDINIPSGTHLSMALSSAVAFINYLPFYNNTDFLHFHFQHGVHRRIYIN